MTKELSRYNKYLLMVVLAAALPLTVGCSSSEPEAASMDEVQNYLKENPEANKPAPEPTGDYSL